MKKIVLVALCILIAIDAHPYDFVVDGIAYHIVSASEKTVEVDRNWNPSTQKNEYSGDIIINENVVYDGTQFTVIGTVLQTFGDSQITSCNLPNSIISLEEGTFMDCHELTSVKLPDNLWYLPKDCFWGCRSLEEMPITPNLQTIGRYAFHGCKKLTKVNIPETVTDIRYGAFMGCEGLVDLLIPKNVVNIEQSAFSWCSQLESIEVRCKKLSFEMFAHANNLKTVRLYDIEYIPSDAFKDCSEIEKIYVNMISPSPISESAFEQKVIMYAKLYVPTGSINNYKATEGWKDFFNIIEVEPSSISTSKMEKKEDTKYFTIDGKMLNTPQKGINIIQTNNGTAKKVLVK